MRRVPVIRDGARPVSTTIKICANLFNLCYLCSQSVSSVFPICVFCVQIIICVFCVQIIICVPSKTKSPAADQSAGLPKIIYLLHLESETDLKIWCCENPYIVVRCIEFLVALRANLY